MSLSGQLHDNLSTHATSVARYLELFRSHIHGEQLALLVVHIDEALTAIRSLPYRSDFNQSFDEYHSRCKDTLSTLSEILAVASSELAWRGSADTESAIFQDVAKHVDSYISSLTMAAEANAKIRETANRLRTAISHDQPEQASEALGLIAESQPSVQVVHAGSKDPAAVVFRSQREIKRKSSAGPILIGLFVLGVAGAGLWLTVKPRLTTQGDAEHSLGVTASHAKNSSGDLSGFKTGYWLINGSTQIDDGKVVIRSDGAPGEHWTIHVAGGASYEGLARATLSDDERDGDKCLTAQVTMETRNEYGSIGVPLRQGICMASREIDERNEGTTFFVDYVAQGALYLFSETKTVLDIKPAKQIKNLPPPTVIDVLDDDSRSAPPPVQEAVTIPEMGADTSNELSLDQNLLRFDSAAEVLELARRKQADDWTPEAMRECVCTINGNVIELSADRRIVLYNEISGLT